MKGHFQSLRGLGIRINRESSLQFASLWIATCIHLHSFALDSEDGHFTTADTFYQEGQRVITWEQLRQEQMEVEREWLATEREQEHVSWRDINLQHARQKQEHLKTVLYDHLCSQL